MKASIHSRLQYLRESRWLLCHMKASIHSKLQYVRESCWLLSANSFGTHKSQHSFATSVCAKICWPVTFCNIFGTRGRKMSEHVFRSSNREQAGHSLQAALLRRSMWPAIHPQKHRRFTLRLQPHFSLQFGFAEDGLRSVCK